LAGSRLSTGDPLSDSLEASPERPRGLALTARELEVSPERPRGLPLTARELAVSPERPRGLPLTARELAVSPERLRGLPLTARELEVVTLLARGRHNRQIADALVIASSTVERHVANILSKLSLHSRTEVALWAVENQLLSRDGERAV
jgi:DNA-binding NarL/FixJ family response regulator